jgi:hypothetical protein
VPGNSSGNVSFEPTSGPTGGLGEAAQNSLRMCQLGCTILSHKGNLVGDKHADRGPGHQHQGPGWSRKSSNVSASMGLIGFQTCSKRWRPQFGTKQPVGPA